jgi:hypothetical protein
MVAGKYRWVLENTAGRWKIPLGAGEYRGG